MYASLNRYRGSDLVPGDRSVGDPESRPPEQVLGGRGAWGPSQTTQEMSHRERERRISPVKAALARVRGLRSGRR